jgi:hypothetical protein
MKEVTQKKSPIQEKKDNKLVKWTPFPPDTKETFNFSSIMPVNKVLKCIHTFPVILY